MASVPSWAGKHSCFTLFFEAFAIEAIPARRTLRALPPSADVLGTRPRRAWTRLSNGTVNRGRYSRGGDRVAAVENCNAQPCRPHGGDDRYRPFIRRTLKDESKAPPKPRAHSPPYLQAPRRRTKLWLARAPVIRPAVMNTNWATACYPYGTRKDHNPPTSKRSKSWLPVPPDECRPTYHDRALRHVLHHDGLRTYDAVCSYIQIGSYFRT